MEARPTVAVLNPGDPTDPSVWSGTPSGVVRGLRAAGADVVPISVDLPARAQRYAAAALLPAYLGGARRFEGRSRLQVAHSAAQISAPMTRLRARRARRALAGAAIDAAVAINLSFVPPPGVRVATFEDMTIRQALTCFDYAHWDALPPADVARRLAMQREAYHSVHACCATNSWAAGSMIDDYGANPARVHVVGVGSNFPVDDAERDWSTPRFLFVGREWERKNGPAVVRAFAGVRAAYPDAELHLVGGHPDVTAAGIVGHGTLRLGDERERATLRGIFAQATCFVMPSLLEPSAVAYTEAAAAGIGSIGTSAGGSADLIGDAGIVVAPRDDDAILAAMLSAADPATAALLGERARRRAPLLTWEAVGGRLLAALDLAPAPDVPLLAPATTSA